MDREETATYMILMAASRLHMLLILVIRHSLTNYAHTKNRRTNRESTATCTTDRHRCRICRRRTGWIEWWRILCWALRLIGVVSILIIFRMGKGWFRISGLLLPLLRQGMIRNYLTINYHSQRKAQRNSIRISQFALQRCLTLMERFKRQNMELLLTYKTAASASAKQSCMDSQS